MSVATAAEPILLGLDAKTWGKQLDRAASWFGNVLMTQEKFRKLAEDTPDAVREPHIKQYIREIANRAKGHEEQARNLFRAIGRKPSDGRSLAGTVMSKASEAVASVVGLAGGAEGSWQDIRKLLLVGQDALGAVAIAEQIGYAMGLPELAEPAYRVVAEKMKDQLLIQEYMLERVRRPAVAVQRQVPRQVRAHLHGPPLPHGGRHHRDVRARHRDRHPLRAGHLPGARSRRPGDP